MNTINSCAKLFIKYVIDKYQHHYVSKRYGMFKIFITCCKEKLKL